jgi:hypothetical protein
MFRDRSAVEPAVQRINVTEAYDVRLWAERFGCTSRQLRDAVGAVGNIASDVQRHLMNPYAARDARAAVEAAFGG